MTLVPVDFSMTIDVSTHMPNLFVVSAAKVSTHMPLARHDVAGITNKKTIHNFYSHASCEA